MEESSFINYRNPRIQRLINYAETSKVYKGITGLIRRYVRYDAFQIIKDEFATYDKDHDGLISKAEFYSVLKNDGCSEEEITGVFDKLDSDKNEFINYDEYVQAASHDLIRTSKEALIATFRKLDANKDGKLSIKELVTGLNNIQDSCNIVTITITDNDIEDFMSMTRDNTHEEIDFEKFVKLINECS